jgi:C4-dicarboxylate-specific signal transduction histidine kinase
VSTGHESNTRPGRSLAQSEKLRALGQMASGIAHDLNQWLMLISSYSARLSQPVRRDR